MFYVDDDSLVSSLIRTLPFKENIIELGTSVSKGRDVPRDVPGQTGTGRPVVPLSRDKKKILVPVSRCPGTRAGANVPGQTPLSRPGTKRFKNFQIKETRFPVLEHHFSVLEHPFLF